MATRLNHVAIRSGLHGKTVNEKNQNWTKDTGTHRIQPANDVDKKRRDQRISEIQNQKLGG